MEGVKATIENEYGVYSVHAKENTETINEYMDRVIEPLLLAVGFHQRIIDEYFEPSKTKER